MILGFQKRFVHKILADTKIHTIREDKHDRWRDGRPIQMATGVRTKKYRCFNDRDSCKGTQKISITHTKRGFLRARIAGKNVSHEGLMLLARNDGFESLIDFCLWFNKDFVGKIIHWTDFRY